MATPVRADDRDTRRPPVPAPARHPQARHPQAQHPHARPAHPGPPVAHRPWGYLPPRPTRNPFVLAWRFVDRLGRRPAWLAPLAVLACVGAAAGTVLSFDPTDNRPDLIGPCSFKAVTGLDCPGCGGTRMVWFLLHGNLPEAARHHAVALLTVPLLAWAYVAWAGYRLTGRRLPMFVVTGRALALYGVLWLVFSVARNLPWPPFTFLYV